MFSADYIRERIRRGQHKYMGIHTQDRKLTIDAAHGTVQDLLVCFNDFEENCLAGRYLIELYNDENTKPGKKTDLEARKVILYSKDQSAAGGVSMGGGSSFPEKYMKDTIELRTQLQQMQFDQKLEKLEQGSNDRMYSMLEKIFMHMTFSGSQQTNGGSLAGGQPAPAGDVPGTSNVNTNDTDDFAQKLAEWNELDPDVNETVAALAELAKKDPKAYAQYRSFLVGGPKQQNNSENATQ